MAVKDVICWLLPGVPAVEMGKLREPRASRNPESAAVPRVLDNVQIYIELYRPQTKSAWANLSAGKCGELETLIGIHPYKLDFSCPL